MSIVVVGLSHQTTPIEIREKLCISEKQIEKAIAHLCGYPHVEEVVILSTCNRLEIYTAATEPEQAVQEIVEFMAEHSKLPLHRLHRHLFVLLQQDAVKHLMQVASGLDSLVIGEGQILAQVKHAYKISQQNNSVKYILNQLFKQVIMAAKRVRTETSISKGAVSISSAAVELAQIKVQNLSSCRVTIVGAGKMSKRLVQHLLAKKVTRISIVNRSIKHAEELANQFVDAQLHYYPITKMMSVVAASDLVFTSTASAEPLLNRDKLEASLELNQPLTLFDISVPRNIDADVNELPRVQVFNVDDLKAVVLQNQKSRQQMALEAQVLLEEEVKTFYDWYCSLETVSTISCLRRKVEAIREQELEKVLSRLGSELDRKHQAAIETLTRCIINKILHEPMVQLRTQEDLVAQRLALQSLQMLFNLDTEKHHSSITKTPSQK